MKNPKQLQHPSLLQNNRGGFTLLLLLLFPVLTALGTPNPAAVYCQRLGYEYKTITTNGKTQGIAVIAPDVEYDAWDFFKGKVGQEYSFAALHGYDIECVSLTTNGFTVERAMCYPHGTRHNASSDSATGIALEALMTQKGMPLFDSAPRQVSRQSSYATCEDEDLLRIYRLMGDRQSLPTSFDWRAHNNKAYIGPIRDQGACGSCYSFAACAAAEGAYNWAVGQYDNNCADFSESYIIWCLARKPQYSAHFYGCEGADYTYSELKALTKEGVADESAFPYRVIDPGSCVHWDAPTTVFSSWHRLPYNDIEAIKTAIMTYGVVDAAVDTDANFNDYAGGVYQNNATNCPNGYNTVTDHAIALVGWDDNPPEGGGGCWILRNTWGANWGENGYMRIRYNAARVTCAATYLTYTSPPSRKLTITSAHGGANPPAGLNTYRSGATITCIVTNSPVIDGTNRYVCIGWTGTGNAPAAGYGMSTGPFTLTTDSSVTWLWATNVLPAPSIVSASAGKHLNVVTVSWQAVPSATGYQLWRNTHNDPASAVLIVPAVTNTIYADTGVLVGPLYHYWVKAVNAQETSTFSAYATGWRGAFSTGVSADYDGDGFADPCLYNESAGIWQAKLSASGYATFSEKLHGLGGRGYASIAADYDGDGLADPATYYELTGTWTALSSARNYVKYVLPYAFGGSGFIAAPADYDGDGLADPALYQAETGDWQVRYSAQNYRWFKYNKFLGGANYLPVPADYDGDGLADPCVYEQKTGIWIARLSGNNYTAYIPTWKLGGADWTPAPADYDGDGLADPAVHSADGQAWYIRWSSKNYAVQYIELTF